MSRQGHLFEGARLQMTESIELTVATFIDALRERGAAIVA